MIPSAATQQTPIRTKLRARRAGIAAAARHVRGRTDSLAEIPPDSSPLPSNPPQRRLRLVGEKGDPARKVWRLQMDASDVAVKLPGLAGALRLLSAARALLARSEERRVGKEC